MTKLFALTAAALMVSSTASFAAGDAVAGEKGFNKCKSCHMIVDGDNTIVKGGKTGPNLYGIMGTAIASGDFKFGAGISSVAEANPDMVWTEELVAEYVVDPNAFITTYGGNGKSKMTFKLKKGGEDVAAYLASVAPAQ
ncbi:c-type cytochrome [Celeribacter marinus]|uniref:Cytochrome c2 n=1 Tax=Celeribacter marinus TaxID=1397108 RepID=A0A0N7HIB2_9RHOB|nr:hypothetical protein [Celeribacter marinus]ALI54733.1 cytochrome c2 [Celeribacter marinus]SFK54834.1 cytochrome c [Celeribacter marinus]